MNLNIIILPSINIICSVHIMHIQSTNNLFILFYRMLDDFGQEMENTDHKMDNVMKKMAKVMHMSNGMVLLLDIQGFLIF